MYEKHEVYKHTVLLEEIFLFRDESKVCIAMVLDYTRNDLKKIIENSDEYFID